MEPIVREFADRDAFAGHLGIEITEAVGGRASGRMEIRPQHLNGAGTVHGGAIYGLADAVFAVASNSHGTLAMAIEVSMSYFKAMREGTLFAEAEEVSINPRLATYLITVRDTGGETIALFKGTVYRKKQGLKEILYPEYASK